MKIPKFILSSVLLTIHLFLFNLPSNAQAQVTAHATRPSTSDNGYLTETDYVELETGLVKDDKNWSIPALLKYSPFKQVELGFSMQGILTRVNSETELGDPGVQIKVQIANAAWGAFALVGRTDWPSGLRPKFSGYGVLSYQALKFQADVTLGGAFFDQGNGNYDQSGFYALAVSPKLNGRVSGYLEVFGENVSGRNNVAIDTGISFSHNLRLVSDISLGIGLTENSPDWVLQVGFTSTLFKL